jgi:hypothetical protein
MLEFSDQNPQNSIDKRDNILNFVEIEDFAEIEDICKT